MTRFTIEDITYFATIIKKVDKKVLLNDDDTALIRKIGGILQIGPSDMEMITLDDQGEVVYRVLGALQNEFIRPGIIVNKISDVLGPIMVERNELPNLSILIKTYLKSRDVSSELSLSALQSFICDIREICVKFGASSVCKIIESLYGWGTTQTEKSIVDEIEMLDIIFYILQIHCKVIGIKDRDGLSYTILEG